MKTLVSEYSFSVDFRPASAGIFSPSSFISGLASSNRLSVEGLAVRRGVGVEGTKLRKQRCTSEYLASEAVVG